MGNPIREAQELSQRMSYINAELQKIDHEEGICKPNEPLLKKVKHALFPSNASRIPKEELDAARTILGSVKKELSKLIVGQQDTIHFLLCAVLANGHVLLEAVPGVAKTAVIRTLATVSGCAFSRIQFTVDLLPTDITGITTYDKISNTFKTIKGPIFANFIIADEINRAPPKTQSALLEAMQERQVTIGDESYRLTPPFFVMATQNPIENSGTYRLPEAQIDRFLFKLLMTYPKVDEEQRILKQNITIHNFSSFNLKTMLSPQDIMKLQQLTHDIYISDAVEEYIVRIVDATRNPKKNNISLGKYIQYGSSPRASIGLYIAAKAYALSEGKGYVTPQHVKAVVPHVLRHRILLTYEADAENVTTEDIIKEILRKVRVP